MEPRPDSLLPYLAEFRALGRAPAYVYTRGYRTMRWSYRDIAEQAARFARELEGRGVARGDRVLLWGPNSGEWAAAFFGCVLRGAVAVPMDEAAAPDFARRVAEQVDAKLIVCSAALPAHVAPAPAIAFENLTEALARHSGEPYPAPALARSDALEIVFTSGTTADPKGVVITHGNVLANIAPLEREIAKYRKYERWFHPIRFLNLLPLSHVFGQFLGLFIPQLIGGVVVFQESLPPGDVLRTVKRERVSVLVTVPRVLQALKEKLERDAQLAGRGAALHRELERSAGEKFLWRWWRFRRVHRRFGWKFWAFISGGAALDAETEEFWRRLGYVVVQGYGMTETTSLVSVQHPFQMGRRSIGKVLPGREMKLDPATGEIMVRGESIATAYWQGKQLTPVAQNSDDGWLRTGDLGELDSDGNLHFKGRKKNVIVSPAGLNIYPEDLEQALRAQPGVRDAVVVPVARGGNAEPCAVLLLGDVADANAALRGANAQLADYQRVARWLAWPEEDFPRTTTMKPRVAAIQQFVAEQLGGAATRTGASGGALAELVARITGRGVELQPTTTLEELGLSSLDRVELMSALEDRYQVELDEAAFAAATTIADIERMLRHGASVETGHAGPSVETGHAPSPPASSAAVEGAPATGGQNVSRSDAGATLPFAPAEPAPRYVYPRWSQTWPLNLLRLVAYWLLIWPYMMIFARPRIAFRSAGVSPASEAVALSSPEALKRASGPLLIVCNHITQIDIGYVMAALPPRYRTRLAVAMGGEMLRAMRYPPRAWRTLHRWWEMLRYWLVIAFFNVFPLPQRSGFRQSFAYAGESADRGYSIVVFPEGARTLTGELTPFRSGVGMLAQRLGLPVVPMRIHGLWELKAANKHLARPGAITVSVGELIRYDATMPPEEIAADLERRVREL
jgi:long-chain acyl-CoA synthetase